MSKQGSSTWIARLIGAVALAGLAVWIHPLAALCALIAVGVFPSLRIEPVSESPRVEIDELPHELPDHDHLRNIEHDALLQRVVVTEESLDQMRDDMLSLASIAEKVSPDRAGYIVSRLARLSALTEGVSQSCLLGEQLVEKLGSIDPGTWVIEAALPTVSAPPALTEALMEGLVELGRAAIGEVRCSGAVDGGMALLQLNVFSGEALETSVGFHVAQRAASLLGGGLWVRRRGAIDELLVAIPRRYFPGPRAVRRQTLDFDLMGRP